MANPFRLVVILVSAGVASASIAPKRPALLSPLVNKQLSVRGGAGPLDPELVTKVATGAFLAQGVVATLAPEPSLTSYDASPTPASVLNMRRIGICLVDLSIMAYGMIFKGWSTNTAIGVSCIIWITEFVGSLLNDEATTVGFKNDNIVVWLLLNVATAYLLLTDAACSNTITNAWAVLVIATCGPFMFFPSAGYKAYGYDISKITDGDLAMFKSLGGCLTAIGVFMAAVARGVDPSKAFGYSLIPAILNMVVMLFITKENDKLGVTKGPAYFWLLFDVIVAATLAFD